MNSIEARFQPQSMVKLFLLAGTGIAAFYFYFGYLPYLLKLATAVLVVAVPFGIKQSFDGRPRIVINEQGILDRRQKVGTIRWADIRRAYVYSLQGADYVCLELHNAPAYLSRMPLTARTFAWAYKLLGMTSIALSVSGLDVETDTLLEHIHRGCEKAAQQRFH